MIMTVLFQWDNDFNIGIQEIDEQHKVLVSLLNDLHNAIREHHGKATSREILDRLAEYTRTHFLLEESLMRLTHYPGFEIHKAQHEDLIRQVRDLQEKLDKENITITFELLHFLKTWLARHIHDSDKRFGAYFQETNLTKFSQWTDEVNEVMKRKKWWWKFW
ncbi:MAG: Bacteriohemerythrin [Rhodocyclaceae bacterium]|nr:Bacteriohemerythrin [Rhodocyclaceae bacterium]